MQKEKRKEKSHIFNGILITFIIGSVFKISTDHGKVVFKYDGNL